MRQKKVYRRGCKGTNNPFGRNSCGVYHLTPAHWSPFHSSHTTSTLHFHTIEWALLAWVWPQLDCESPALCLTLLWIPMHLAAQGHTQSRCIQKYLACDNVPPVYKCVPPRNCPVTAYAAFSQSLKTLLIQIYQIAWDSFSWKICFFCPISIHYYLETSFRWKLCWMSSQCI